MQEEQRTAYEVSSFNRYIVECKFVCNSYYASLSLSFNRYIVECKCTNCCKDINFSYGFNRYIVECKFSNIFTTIRDFVVLIDT